MVMVTRSARRRAGLDDSDLCKVPPWCSGGKSTGRNEARKISLFPWEIRSSQFLLENEWQIPSGDSNRSVQDSTCSKRRKYMRKNCKKENGKCGALWIVTGLLLVLLLPMSPYWKTLKTHSGALTLASETSVDGECCYKMKQLAAALLRAEQIIRKTRRQNTMMLSAQTKYAGISTIQPDFISGAMAYKGSGTEEWGGRAALWGVVPLWRASPPPETVLAAQKPSPGDCWPFSGQKGELLIDLPKYMRPNRISLEHIRPDAVLSAPKDFYFFGILSNGTWIKAIQGHYSYDGPAKQYFTLPNLPKLRKVAFRVLSNHGNLKYTCIYRLHVYGGTIDL